MLDLDNGEQVSAKNTYMEGTDVFEIDEIDIDKIRVSKKYSYKKEHESYKHYEFYEHNDEYIPLKIILSNLIGYYNEFNDTGSKKMHFVLKGNLEDKFYDIFDNIKEKSVIDNIDYAYESGNRGIEYIKTTVSNNTLFLRDNYYETPDKNIKYLCHVILVMKSVYHSTKDKDKDVIYYPQVLLDSPLKPKKKIGARLKKHKKNSESDEPEINEDTVLDE